MNKGRKKLIITMTVALILLVGVTVSYGYIALVSSSKNQEVSVGTGNIHLELDDADSGSIEANLNLGGSITKTLKITNKGTEPGKVQINWKNLINTYNSRSLSYTLETSSSKDTGYTKIEALRENVPVSTEEKEVPLSKEITIPVGNNPIYYRLTITFNDLEDVDQESDLNATLITQFSLSEPESLSKKVIAVLNGNVKTSDPDFSGPAPRYQIGLTTNELLTRKVSSANSEKYLYYGDNYKLKGDGKIDIINPKVGLYKDIYSNLKGKYICKMTFRDSTYTSTVTPATDCNDISSFYHVENSTSTDFTYRQREAIQKHTEREFLAQDTETESTTDFKDKTIYYADSYTYTGTEFLLNNPRSCTYSSCYQSLNGKYTIYGLTDTVGDALCKINSTTLDDYTFMIKYSTEGETIIDYSYDGVYRAQDDYGDSYYYRGGVTNNYFKFGGYYWRIVRVNGDGSIRLYYAGSKAHKNGEYYDSDFYANVTKVNLISSDQNTSFLAKRTAGYMIGVDETTDAFSTSKQEADSNTYDSPLKKALDAWYEANLKINSANGNIDLGIYLSDTLFCSDRSVAPSANLWEDDDTTLGFGVNKTYYGSYYRIKNNNPSLKCPLKNDRFTVGDKKIGNGALKYKIATITGDELMMSGVGIYSNNSLTGYDYLYSNWRGTNTISSAWIGGNYTETLYMIQRVGLNFSFNNLDKGYYQGTVPVINIAPEYALKVIGSGTMTDPFMIPGVN